MMFVLAAREYRVSTYLATGRWPQTSPPVDVQTVKPANLERHGVVYLCLHGRQGDPMLYGDRSLPCLSAGQVASCDLTGAIVYMAGCWGAGPVSDAFLAAGAAAVVADENENWSAKRWLGIWRPLGSNWLGRQFLSGLRHGLPAGWALDQAKDRYRIHTDRDRELLQTVNLLGNPDAMPAGAI